MEGQAMCGVGRETKGEKTKEKEKGRKRERESQPIYKTLLNCCYQQQFNSQLTFRLTSVSSRRNR